MGTRFVSEGFCEERLRSSILRILQENLLCSLSTVNGEKGAHINTAYFCFSEDLELYFLSDPGSLHCRNLSENASAAMAIFRSSQPWGSPGRGIQLFGRCSQARGRQAVKAERLYARRFPAYAKWMACTTKTIS